MKCRICEKETKTLGHHITKYHKDITLKDYYDKYISLTTGKCLVCGKDTRFNNLTKGYSKYCSMSCRNISNQFLQKKKITIENRYGGYSELQKKRETTMLTLYGQRNPSKIKKFRDKAKHTNLKRYGSEEILSVKSIRNKINNTNQQRYGGTGFAVQQLAKKSKNHTILTRKQITEKCVKTQRNRYGGVGFQSKELRAKQINTMIKKYGVTHNSYMPDKSYGFQNKYIGKYSTKFGDLVSYQSNLQLQYIKQCQLNDIRILNGDIIPYFIDGIKHLYYCDFKIFNQGKWHLVEIKGDHSWYKQELYNGLLHKKIEAANEHSKKNNYGEFIFILQGEKL